MCLPALAAPLAIASSVVSAAGQLYAGMQANAQGKYEASVAKNNRQLEIDAAHQSIEAGADERRDFWRKVAQVKGQNIAAMAANGIEVDFGSGERLQSDTDMLARDDAKTLYRNIENRTQGHYINAANYASEAKAAKARGKVALVGSVFGAAGSVLGGLQQASAIRAKAGG